MSLRLFSEDIFMSWGGAQTFNQVSFFYFVLFCFAQKSAISFIESWLGFSLVHKSAPWQEPLPKEHFVGRLFGTRKECTSYFQKDTRSRPTYIPGRNEVLSLVLWETPVLFVSVLGWPEFGQLNDRGWGWV